MSTTEQTTPGETRNDGLGFWYVLAGLVALLILVYLPTLSLLVQNWIDDEDMGHGFFVPLVAGYLAWQKREDIAAIPRRPNYWGIPVLVGGAMLMLVARLGVELFLARVAFLVSLAGLILLYGGWLLLRKIAFPFGMLLFMIPIPAIIYNQITFPLQLFASQVAEHVLTALDVTVLREGNILELPSGVLSVAEACSGIRSLLALSFLSLTYAALFDAKPWMRWALLVTTIPIAISSNAARVTITGLLSEYNPELAKGVFHTMEGAVMYGISLVLLFFAHRALNVVWSRYVHKSA